MGSIEPVLSRTRIAYFSMEIALRPEIHTYSGGLGMLAGDTARSCADLALPVVFVSLVSRCGYVRQEIDQQGHQRAHANPWHPEQWLEPLPAMVSVRIEGREVWIRPWLYRLKGPLGHTPVIMLDTDVPENDETSRQITDHLYGGDEAYRLKQEIVLGIGGLRVLQALGFRIEKYHLNEGHAALLTLQLLRQHRRIPTGPAKGESYDLDAVRERCVFTTHTPVEAAFDQFPYSLVDHLLGPYVESRVLHALAGEAHLNMTQLALNLSGYVNGVSRQHAETTRKMFPGYQVHAITNGVHAATWTHPAFARLYDAAFPHWGHEPEALLFADQLPDDDVWAAHEAAKAELIALVKAQSGIDLDPDLPLIAFARRITEYKRPELLFSDAARLVAIAKEHPFQIVLSGLAHPRDQAGQDLVGALHRHIRRLSGTIPIAFLPRYDMAVASVLVAGANIWLNTPLRPLEASGTSGMKAALNGMLNVSVLDGWWLEAHVEGVTGWAIDGSTESGAGDAKDLYRKLESEILPLYYKDRMRWTWMMKQAISRIGGYFNSHRMVRRYATEAYLR